MKGKRGIKHLICMWPATNNIFFHYLSTENAFIAAYTFPMQRKIIVANDFKNNYYKNFCIRDCNKIFYNTIMTKK